LLIWLGKKKKRIRVPISPPEGKKKEMTTKSFDHCKPDLGGGEEADQRSIASDRPGARKDYTRSSYHSKKRKKGEKKGNRV